MEVARYLRVPFSETGNDWTGCNCWGLVVLAYREELGIELPGFDRLPSTQIIDVAAEIGIRSKLWDKVAEPEPYDVVVMSGISIMNGRSLAVNAHVGLAVSDTHMLHTEEGVGPQCIPLDDPLINRRVVEFRRYAGEC